MIKNKVYDLSSYPFRSGEKVLVDTNIWLYLFPAPGVPEKWFVCKYSLAFKNLLLAGAQPVLDPLVLSEYLNRYIRLVWNGSYKNEYPVFKDFRRSDEFPHIALGAKRFAEKIIGCCAIHSVPPNALDLGQALSNFSSGSSDFNDEILVDICKKSDFKIMTNDGDFLFGGIEVLTANSRLLNS